MTELANRSRSRLSYRGEYRSTVGPAISEAIINHVWLETHFTRPLGNRKFFSVYRQESIPSRVIALRLFSRPSNVHFPLILQTLFTIATRIVSIVINSINAMFGAWLGADINIKGNKIISISLTDCNSTSLVVGSTCSTRSKASILNSLPYRIFRCSTKIVNSLYLSSKIYSITSARLGFAYHQIDLRHKYDTPAFALTVPPTTRFTIGANLTGAFLDYGQTPEYLFYKVNQFTIRFSHAVRSLLANELVRACGARQRFAGLSILSGD